MLVTWFDVCECVCVFIMDMESNARSYEQQAAHLALIQVTAGKLVEYCCRQRATGEFAKYLLQLNQ